MATPYKCTGCGKHWHEVGQLVDATPGDNYICPVCVVESDLLRAKEELERWKFAATCMHSWERVTNGPEGTVLWVCNQCGLDRTTDCTGKTHWSLRI